ncbi:hypothetical protein [Campylobacter molothri]|uniref:hypothetical protein n=1 Tax=Campylobacter molothri TaxID=1032242 RepID=UPI001D6D9B4B|nr:hypothetical protein [Campylobacter sp. W0045]
MADNLEQIANDLNTASLNLQELRGKYEGALDILNAKNAQIIEALDSKKEEALQEVKSVKDTATTEITNLQDTALSKIDESKNTSITELTNKKTEALTKIEEAKTEQGEKIAKLETDLNLKAKLLTQNLTWTVGSGGESNTHFNTLEKAITEALKFTKQNNLVIFIQLTEDLTLTQGLTFSYCDCRNIIIDGQNHTIQKEMTSSTDVMFYALYSAFLPRFTNVTFKNTGLNTNGICFQVYHNSNLNLHGCVYEIDNFLVGVNVAASSSVCIGSTVSKIKNCKTGLQCFALGKLDARSITLENNETGISLIESGLVDAWNIAFTSNTSDCNVAFNTLTQQGICFR